MSRTTVGSVSIALAAVLAVGHAEPVSAKGLNRQQVRALIKKEIAKIPRLRGPRGEDGRPGLQGLQVQPGLLARSGLLLRPE
jgi:hypothetical protein